MKKSIGIILTTIWLSISGCATPGEKFIDIRFTGDEMIEHSGKIGVAPFVDNRTGRRGGYVGYRVLMDGSQETYLVKEPALSETLTRETRQYFKKKGMQTEPISAWEPTIDGMKTALYDFDLILTARINRFECQAIKRGMTTDLTLDIDLTFYLGQADKKTLKTIPVKLTLERKELGFSEAKLEEFVNQSVKEVFKKALVL